MNEERITKVEKEKDPKRVEAGKRLGAISKMAKEKKRLERIEEERGEVNYNPLYMVTGAVLISCALYFYKQSQSQSHERTPRDVSRDEDVSKDESPNIFKL